jgi:hypothetical protein
VEAADRDAVALELLAGVPHLKVREVDLETGRGPTPASTSTASW